MITPVFDCTNCKIDRKLDNGGYGTVFQATDDSGNKAAYKTSADAPTSENGQRFLQENAILHHLSPDKHIIFPFSGVEVRGAESGYYMELADANLENYLRLTNSISFDQKIDLIKQLCTALTYAHSKRVTHRDLWSKNVLLNLAADPVIKLCDFGRSRNFNNPLPGYVPTDLIAVHNYIAPPEYHFQIHDQFTEQHYVFADIYALGMTLTFILGPQPSVHFHRLKADTLDYLTRKFNPVEDFLQLPEQQRQELYFNWCESTTVSATADLKDVIRLETGYNLDRLVEIVARCSHVDYRQRFQSVEDVISELKNL